MAIDTKPHRHRYQLRDAILGNVATEISRAIVEGHLSAEDQIDIYRRHYRFALIDALKATFPIVEKLIGENFFAVMAWRFINRHPPVGPALLEYGNALSGFIDACSQLSTIQPYLADVARLEWALNAAYQAEDTSTVALAALAALPPDLAARTSFTLHPAAQFIRSRFPIDAIWYANQPGAGQGSAIDLDQGGVRLVVYRHERGATWRPVSVPEDTFLAGLAAGIDLETADDAARALGPFDLASTLAWSFSAGLFTELAVPQVRRRSSKQENSVLSPAP